MNDYSEFITNENLEEIQKGNDIQNIKIENEQLRIDNKYLKYKNDSYDLIEQLIQLDILLIGVIDGIILSGAIIFNSLFWFIKMVD